MGRPAPRPPLMPHMTEGTHSHPPITRHPQFKNYLADVNRLQTNILTEAKRKATERWEGHVAKAKEAVAYDNYVRTAAAKKLGVEPTDLIEPTLPPEPQPPYDTEGHWNDFVLHDFNGVSNLSLSMATVLNVISDNIKLSKDSAQVLSPEALLLQKAGNDFMYKTKNQLPPGEKITYTDEFFRVFNKNIGTVMKKDKQHLGEYKKLFANATKPIKIWDMVFNSARMLNAVKDENYEDLDHWLGKLQETHVSVGSIIPAAIKGTTSVECIPKELLKKDLDGVEGIILFNLIKNANVYKNSYIKVYETNGALVVENDSDTPIDKSHLYEPMRPGENKGNTGFGLFTAKKVFGALSGVDLSCETEDATEGRPHIIKFMIKKLPPSDTVSPLPPPSQ